MSSTSPTTVLEAAPRHGRSGMVRRFAGSLSGVEIASLTFLVALVVGMFALPVVFGLDANAMNSSDRLQGPSASYWLGTDNLGRDLLARCLAGARVSLLIGIGSVLAAALIGVPLGMLAGYLRGRVDAVVSFVVDVVFAFPGLVLALVLAAFLGASIGNVMIAIVVPMTPVFIRLAKAQTLSVAQREYVEASQVIGTPTLSIVRRDILPNILQPILAYGLVSVGSAILIEGGLSFLGLGVPPGQASWGSMIDGGRDYLREHALIILMPAVFMLLTILGLNLVADRFLSTRDAAKAGM